MKVCYFVASGDADVVDTGGAGDIVYVLKKSGTVWTVDAGHSVLTQTDRKTGAVLSSVNISGIDQVGYWNGKTMKAAGTALFSPAEQRKTVAYVDAAPAAPSSLSVKA